MGDPTESQSAQRNTPPTPKERNAIQRVVTTLLDALAPERATVRTERLPVPIEQHRTPSGCVLQAATAALSVSWFSDSANDAGLGELQIVLWRGVVSRRGAGAGREGAVVVRELTLRPVEPPPDATSWRDSDGTIFAAEGLPAFCLGLLKDQMLVDDPTGSAVPPSPRRRD
jgi:hypothetical protein